VDLWVELLVQRWAGGWYEVAGGDRGQEQAGQATQRVACGGAMEMMECWIAGSNFGPVMSGWGRGMGRKMLECGEQLGQACGGGWAGQVEEAAGVGCEQGGSVGSVGASGAEIPRRGAIPGGFGWQGTVGGGFSAQMELCVST
jgi:hypothetical protein